MKDPPEDFFCMICAKLLNEPHLTDCCGQHFCGVCLERWFEKQAKKICPHCRSESFTYMRYLPLKRKINALQVYCPFKKEGCEEITTIGEVKTHQDVCGFTLVLCNQGCGASVLRKNLLQHCDQECPKRKIKCQYCGKVDHFEVINGEHVNTCEDYPVNCPRGCDIGIPIKRKDLVLHAKVCPLEQVPCTFHEAGCDVMVLRKDLKSHLESNMPEHLMKMMTSHMELKQEHMKLSREHNKLKVKNVTLESEHKQLKKECSLLSSQVKSLTLAEPVKLDDHDQHFTFHPTSSSGWVSPPFFVLDGYKFCIEHKNGDKASLLLLRGEFDDKLKWPINLRYELGVTFFLRTTLANPLAFLTRFTNPPQNFRLSGSNPDLSRVEVACSCRELTVLDLPVLDLPSEESLDRVTVQVQHVCIPVLDFQVPSQRTTA